ncbi:DNA polymerase III subunit gamma and tau [Gleimia hominis]|uniref:DNA-directed DNA polymerase n=1 Tax=Gleimia hominis TaxID=595468 RepID=A0ABU3I894_9ACTO|nr:DNA polymerase III subunit gamma and tau [Gleimia hominis]MDT3766602.1 DNA polymerase III subunit gamma and tau [Gleimia hominis]
MSTALYRRYRPETFDEVIGQSHVTEPLKAALRANRVTHAYLFSGPRGCGKTTSARILARCLNCAEGPTDTPCGKCESCVELATGGPGSLDVIEIDAASHNGVDDARELRERATFAPVRDRYRVFILDEAHMVTQQGFNALLKLVEEPPEHVKFIFATTEPERVIGTIRSRTHHYPFRLVPGDIMMPFLQGVCDREAISVEEGVLSLVVRAGGGSVRDSLSVLDQLMAGSADSQLTYESAVALLGYTDDALLDDAVGALAQSDGARIYSAVERMVDSGHDPRRFVEDLLQRLRDLLIITVAGEGARDILGQLPKAQVDAMYQQAKEWNPARLSRAADLADEALRTMVGATSPRLQLELLVGRILVEASQAAVSPHSQGSVDLPAGAQGSGAQPTGSEAARARPARSWGNGPQSAEPRATDENGEPLSNAQIARAELRRVQEERRRAQQEKLQQSEPAPQRQQSAQTSAGDLQPEQSRATAPQPAQASAAMPKPEQKPAAAMPQPAQASAAMSQPEQKPAAAMSQPESTGPAQQSEPTGSAQRPEPTRAPMQDTGGDTVQGSWERFLETVRTLRSSSRSLMENANVVAEDTESVTFGFMNDTLVRIFMSGHAPIIAQAVKQVTGSAKTVQGVVKGQEPSGAPAGHANQTDRTRPAASSASAPVGNRPAASPEASASFGSSTSPEGSTNSGSAATPASSGWGPVAVPGRGRNQTTRTAEQDSSAHEGSAQTGAPQNPPEPGSSSGENNAGEPASGSAGDAENNATEVAKNPQSDRYASAEDEGTGLAENIAQTSDEPAAPSLNVPEEKPEGESAADARSQANDIPPSEAFATSARSQANDILPSEVPAYSPQTQLSDQAEHAESEIEESFTGGAHRDDADFTGGVSKDDTDFTGGARRDDASVESTVQIGYPVVEKLLDARILEEIPENPEGGR